MSNDADSGETQHAAATVASAAPRGGLIGALLWPMRVLKRLYAWVVGWADTRWGTPALFVLSFVESSFFPIPPDPLLVALCLGKRRRSMWYALVCTVASVLGGIAGWFIGQALFGFVIDVISALGAQASWFGTPTSGAGVAAPAGDLMLYPDGYFYQVHEKFEQNALVAYFSAALSPIPYKVFTIAGGVFDVSLAMLIVGSVAGRGLRFFSLGTLIYLFGDKVKPILEKYFEWITVGIVVLLVLFFVVLRYAL
ncbi:MAG: DedA family protein [Planctomycetes bacterium]|nr:DedA family protein [Planctomycetota bacterium]